MASIIWATFSFVLGLGIYTLLPLTVSTAPIKLRHKIGKAYLKMAARLFKQWTFLRRVLSGYDVTPIKVDDEQKLLKVTLTKNRLNENKEYPFTDPDGRIKRLFNKPVALAYEKVPAAVDAELSEIGYWVREHDINKGLIQNDGLNDDPKQYDPETTDLDDLQPRINPYVTMSDDLRLIDPIDVFEIVPNDIDPENIKTVEALTRQRFSKYGSAIGLTETLAVLMGFGMAGVSMAAAAYVQQRILRGGTASGPDLPNFFMTLTPHVLDIAGVVV